MSGEKVVPLSQLIPPFSLDGSVPRFQTFGGVVEVEEGADTVEVKKSKSGFYVDVWDSGKFEGSKVASGVNSTLFLTRNGLSHGDAPGFQIDIYPDVVFQELIALIAYFAQTNPDVPNEILKHHIKKSMPYAVIDDTGIRFGTMNSGDLFCVNSDGIVTMMTPEELPKEFLEESEHDDVLKHGVRINIASPWIIYEKFVARFSNPNETYEKFIIVGIRYKTGGEREIMTLVERAYKYNVWDPAVIPELIKPYVQIINRDKEADEVD